MNKHINTPKRPFPLVLATLPTFLLLLSSNVFAEQIDICHRSGGSETTTSVTNNATLDGHISHTLDTNGACDESDSSDPDSGVIEADSGDPDFFIPSCNSDPVKREEICNQFYETVDSSYYDDSSDFADDSGTLSTICTTFDFSIKKMVICHKNKNTLSIANQGACNGHFPNHEDDYFGPCLDDNDNIKANESNASCISNDSSSLFISSESIAADSGLEAAVIDCDDSTPVDPSGNAFSGRGGRFNWREFFK